MAKKEILNKDTGEITEPLQALNQVIVHEGRRPDGSYYYNLDFKNCPTLTEQHTGHLTNVNYLMEKYQPDELAAYLAQRNQYRKEILGHDFTLEPDYQGGLNYVYNLKKAWNEVPEKIRSQFRSHVEFLKYIDNPANQEKLVELGLFTQDQIDAHVKNPNKPNDESNDEIPLTPTPPSPTPKEAPSKSTK